MGRKVNITGPLYFYIHFATEVICFYFLSKVIGDNALLWSVPFFYDALAFVPQSLVGRISDKFPKIPFGALGLVFMSVALALFSLLPTFPIFISVLILCLGNAFAHVAGAEVTLRASNGKITPAAIFVAGGSVGVITGKLLADVAPFWFIILLAVSALPPVFLAEIFRKRTEKDKNPCKNFDLRINLSQSDF